jgi:hypothetical protein
MEEGSVEEEGYLGLRPILCRCTYTCCHDRIDQLLLQDVVNVGGSEGHCTGHFWQSIDELGRNIPGGEFYHYGCR